MRVHYLCFFALFWFQTHAQVGINTTAPKSLLDIPASNAAAPAATDGVLIPRIDDFPVVTPE